MLGLTPLLQNTLCGKQYLQMHRYEFLRQNLWFCQLFLCFQFCSFVFVIQLLYVFLFLLFLTFCQVLLSLLFFFYPSVFSDSFIPPSLYASSHLSWKGERKREYTIRKLLSHTVQEGDSMSKIKQFSLTTRWMHSLCLTFSHHFIPPSSFTKSPSISSILPPPFSIFLHFQTAVTLVYPAWIPLEPSKPYQPK